MSRPSSKDIFIRDLASELCISEDIIIQRLKDLGYTRFQKAKITEYKKAITSDEIIRQTVERERVKSRFKLKLGPEPGPCPVPGCEGVMLPVNSREALFANWACSIGGHVHATASWVAHFRARVQHLSKEDELAFMLETANHLEQLHAQQENPK